MALKETTSSFVWCIQYSGNLCSPHERRHCFRSVLSLSNLVCTRDSVFCISVEVWLSYFLQSNKIHPSVMCHCLSCAVGCCSLYHMEDHCKRDIDCWLFTGSVHINETVMKNQNLSSLTYRNRHWPVFTTLLLRNMRTKSHFSKHRLNCYRLQNEWIYNLLSFLLVTQLVWSWQQWLWWTMWEFCLTKVFFFLLDLRIWYGLAVCTKTALSHCQTWATLCLRRKWWRWTEWVFLICFSVMFV